MIFDPFHFDLISAFVAFSFILFLQHFPLWSINMTNPSKVQKPALDEREYQHLMLDNHLSVLLIHDPVCDKASAALDCGVGYFSDPEDVPGLAHFLEHMLFMGTAKYPKENEYSDFLAKHGGHSNAYTSTVHTNYYFDVGHAHLEPALDRFAQFFIAPLFNRDGVDREMNAVDSGLSLKIQGSSYFTFLIY